LLYLLERGAKSETPVQVCHASGIPRLGGRRYIHGERIAHRGSGSDRLGLLLLKNGGCGHSIKMMRGQYGFHRKDTESFLRIQQFLKISPIPDRPVFLFEKG
jgi:hypothetical protein